VIIVELPRHLWRGFN